MSEMIDRVARALFEDWLTKESVIQEQEQNGPYPPWERQGEMGHRPWLQSARAAINAMREPTEWMMANASAVSVADSCKTYESCGPLVVAINKAMIDAALTD